jgi:hypothetical protein
VVSTEVAVRCLPCISVAETATSARSTPLTGRAKAHWIAVGSAAAVSFSLIIGDRLSSRVVTAGACAPGTQHETGAALFWLAFFVFTPVTVVAAIVSLVRGPRRGWIFVADVGAVIVVVCLIGYVIKQEIDWAYICST